MTHLRIVSFSSPAANAVGRIDAWWRRPGDAIIFELITESDGDPHTAMAQVWTNANRNDDPAAHRGVPMQRVKVEGRSVTWRVAIPIHRVGNYRAVGRVSVDNGLTWMWMSDAGIADVRFRPRNPTVSTLNAEEVSIPNVNRSDGARCGTFADMMETGSPLAGGRYTLQFLARQGKNCVWLLPTFEASPVLQPHADDVAGSPYAVRDFFSIRSELTRAAGPLRGEAARHGALNEFRAFVAHAHGLGIKVVLDVPLNHLGHRYRFRDLFVDDGHREVRELDFSGIPMTNDQRRDLEKRLSAPRIPRDLEHLLPWMFGSLCGDPGGADAIRDIAPGGWFEWTDTMQLNHGRRRTGFREWRDEEERPAHRAVTEWLGRVLRFWAVDMRVDGFRLDHLAGAPLGLLDHVCNAVQADVDRHEPGRTVLFIGEDFDTAHRTQNSVDVLQGGWFENLLRARTTLDFRAVLESPWFNHVLSLSTHDEDRFMERLGGDERRALRLASLLPLLGGPVVEVAGDHFGERGRLPFQQYRVIESLRTVTAAGRRMAEHLGRVGRIRAATPALQRSTRAWPVPAAGQPDMDLLVLSRCPLAGERTATWVCCNLDDDVAHEDGFMPDPATRDWLDMHARYRARDLLDDGAPVWERPMNGREMLTAGIPVRLGAGQLRVLVFEVLHADR